MTKVATFDESALDLGSSSGSTFNPEPVTTYPPPPTLPPANNPALNNTGDFITTYPLPPTLPPPNLGLDLEAAAKRAATDILSGVNTANTVNNTSNTAITGGNVLAALQKNYAVPGFETAGPSQEIQKKVSSLSVGTKDEFTIEYGAEGSKKKYVFALLPAMDSSAGKGMGAMPAVPEVKPGIVIRSMMKQKNIIIPGGVSVVQTIGVDSTVLQAVGAFIGSEKLNSNDKKPDLSPVYQGLTGTYGQKSSADKAREFMEKVVFSGRPIKFKAAAAAITEPNTTSYKEMKVEYTGVVLSFKFYAQRYNRTYYTLDILLTDYDVVKRATAA